MPDNSKKQKRVLVTALGTMNSATIIKELRKMNEDFYIIGADINPVQTIFTSTEVDEYHQFPWATTDRESYFRFIKDFCIEHKVDVYYCVVDEEVESMAMHRDELAQIGVTLCVANTDAIVICHNKDKFALWSEQNIPEYCIKRYARYEDINDSDFPLFVKPRKGRASIGCAKIDKRSELENYLDDFEEYIVQEYTIGTVIAADIVCCRKTGFIQVCQRQELLRNKNGCGVAVKIVRNEVVEAVCHKIAVLLDLNGVVNAEFFVNDNDVRIIEVNPRIPAGVEYSCLAGLNIVELAYLIASGKEIKDNQELKSNVYYAKRYETYEYVIKPINEESVTLTVFSDVFLKKSFYWLNDEEIRKDMDIQYNITHEMQSKWFEGLPSRTDYKIWGLECNGLPIGACGFRNISDQQGELTCYIGEPEYREKGISEMMIKLLEQKAVDLGLKQIKLKVLITNKRAYLLFTKCGFREFQRDDKFIKMTKTLLFS
jgi:carbamoyl-phosphate synthase large subunit